MLEAIITSRTRVRMLLRLFLNGASTSYLREMAEEFGESTNSVRVELNNLTQAGYLQAFPDGRTIRYRANESHPMFPELQRLVRKYVGIDRIIDQVLQRLGDLQAAYIVGDYASGKDTGTIEVVLVGDINTNYLSRLLEKAKPLLPRKISVKTFTREAFAETESQLMPRLLIHQSS